MTLTGRCQKNHFFVVIRKVFSDLSTLRDIVSKEKRRYGGKWGRSWELTDKYHSFSSFESPPFLWKTNVEGQRWLLWWTVAPFLLTFNIVQVEVKKEAWLTEGDLWTVISSVDLLMGVEERRQRWLTADRCPSTYSVFVDPLKVTCLHWKQNLNKIREKLTLQSLVTMNVFTFVVSLVFLWVLLEHVLIALCLK